MLSFKELLRFSGVVGLPTGIGYYLGDALGKVIENSAKILGYSTYANLSYSLSNTYLSNFSTYTQLLYLHAPNLDSIIESVFKFSLGGICFALSLYYYLKSRSKQKGSEL